MLRVGDRSLSLPWQRRYIVDLFIPAFCNVIHLSTYTMLSANTTAAHPRTIQISQSILALVSRLSVVGTRLLAKRTVGLTFVAFLPLSFFLATMTGIEDFATK